MTDRLTAEDAARLLEGTTPGPWWAKGRVGGKRVIDLVRELVDDDEAPPHLAQDLDLIAAAPALAAALADSVPKAEHESALDALRRTVVERDAAGRALDRNDTERDDFRREVSRLREALEAASTMLLDMGWGRLSVIEAALAEGSDVPDGGT